MELKITMHKRCVKCSRTFETKNYKQEYCDKKCEAAWVTKQYVVMSVPWWIMPKRKWEG